MVGLLTMWLLPVAQSFYKINMNMGWKITIDNSGFYPMLTSLTASDSPRAKTNQGVFAPDFAERITGSPLRLDGMLLVNEMPAPLERCMRCGVLPPLANGCACLCHSCINADYPDFVYSLDSKDFFWTDDAWTLQYSIDLPNITAAGVPCAADGADSHCIACSEHSWPNCTDDGVSFRTTGREVIKVATSPPCCQPLTLHQLAFNH
jgi:hypothetical protein